ncbi:hypothetical protein ACFL7M_05975 [Thermodesulfobacteriota bacterium]
MIHYGKDRRSVIFDPPEFSGIVAKLDAVIMGLKGGGNDCLDESECWGLEQILYDIGEDLTFIENNFDFIKKESKEEIQKE